MFFDFLWTHLEILYEFTGAIVFFAVLVIVCGVLISRFDKIPLEDAVYFAVVTAFTVGFGDLSPRSRGARLVSMLLAFAGMIFIGIIVAVSVRALDIVLDSGPIVR